MRMSLLYSPRLFLSDYRRGIYSSCLLQLRLSKISFTPYSDLENYAMATHSSAIKRHRQSLKRREQNRLAKATFRTFVKKTLKAVEAKDVDAANSFSKGAISLIDKAVVHGVLHKNTARRTISRLQKRVNSISA